LGTTETVTLGTTLTDVNKAFLVFSGGGAAGARPGRDCWRGEITNTTTLTFTRINTTSCSAIEWAVVEFSAGVTVQHGQVIVPTSGDTHRPLGFGAALTADTVESGFYIMSQSANDSIWRGYNVRGRYADQDNIEFACSEDDGTHVIEYQVVVYDDTSEGRNIPGEFKHVASSVTDGTATIRDTVDTSKTILIGSAAIHTADSGTGTAVDAIDALWRFTLDDSTTVGFHRGDGQATTMAAYLGWQLFEFLDGATVQEFSISLSTTQTSNTATITAVTLANSFIIPGTMQGWGECSDTRASDLSQGFCGLALTDTTTVTATRDAHDSTSCTITGYVVDMTGSS